MLQTISVLTELSQFFFSWTDVNSGYNNQKIAFSKDNGKTFIDIDFAQGVWTYNDLDNYIKEKTKMIDSSIVVGGSSTLFKIFYLCWNSQQ